MPLILKKEPNLAVRQVAFAFQRQAVEAIRDLEYAAVFHEQGLGKTKIAIDLLLYWLESKVVDTVLLVAKKGLIANWLKELAAHSFLRPRVLTTDSRTNFYVLNSPTRLVLAHYEAIHKERKRFQLFLRSRTVGIILDESTKIKNPEAALTCTFFELSSLFKRRVIMTGTPVANRPYDIWAQVKFLDGGRALGTDFDQVKKHLDLSNDLASSAAGRAAFERDLTAIHEKLAPFSVRETKNSVELELPAKVIRNIRASWEPRQLELYKLVQREFRAIVVRDGLPTEDSAENALKRLLRLVQIASNPRLIDQSYVNEPAKLGPLLELLEGVAASEEKCIVWTSFVENADWLASQLRPYGPARIHGKMSIEQRTHSVERFLSDPKCRVLVATPGAAKEGLTLTVANHVVFFDRSFSLDDYLQAQDRIHRVSQTRTCYVYNLILQDSIDEWVELLLNAKQLAAALAQGDISPEYFQSQISYTYGDVVRGVLGLETSTDRVSSSGGSHR